MILGLTYYEICSYFLIYSFLGWVLEVVYHAVSKGKIINRGFLNGPVCPVYGFGMLAILVLTHSFQSYSNGQETPVWLLFIGGVVLCSLVELIAGWILDICFHARWWDYRKEPFNINGYICLRFSLLWGVGVVAVVKGLQPIMEKSPVSNSPGPWIWWFMAGFYLIYLFDFIITLAALIGLNKKLKAIDKASGEMRKVSDALTAQIADAGIEAGKIAGEAQVQTALLKDDIQTKAQDAKEVAERKYFEKKVDRMHAFKEREDRIESLRNDVFGKKHTVIARILRAFPNLEAHDHPEIIERLKEEMHRIDARQ